MIGKQTITICKVGFHYFYQQSEKKAEEKEIKKYVIQFFTKWFFMCVLPVSLTELNQRDIF